MYVQFVHRIYNWEGNMMFVATIPDQTIDGPLSITMPYDRTLVRDNSSPRILRWCAGRPIVVKTVPQLQRRHCVK